MSDFWRGYANVNDDVRHTYERVFFGRETTANLDASEVPGMVQPVAPMAVDNSTTTTVNNYGVQPDATAFYGSVWGNGDALPVGPGPSPIGPEPTPGSAAAPIEAPPIEAPRIEAPRVESPRQGDDMTPGY
jgi:hypothetical protein